MRRISNPRLELRGTLKSVDEKHGDTLKMLKILQRRTPTQIDTFFDKKVTFWVESFLGEFKHFFILCTIIVTVISEFDQIS